MTALQISAILYLLLAFGVPQVQVDTVRGILEASKDSKAVQTVNTPVPMTQDIGSVGSVAPAQDCTPTISASVVKTEGSIDTGVSYMFNATSTYPIGCTLDRNTRLDLQTPSNLYKGTIGAWINDGGHEVELIDGGFVYHQGWGTPPGIQPSGSFIMYLGNISTTTGI